MPAGFAAGGIAEHADDRRDDGKREYGVEHARC